MESLNSYLYLENFYNILIVLNILDYKFRESLNMYKINWAQNARRMEDDRILKEILAFAPKEKKEKRAKTIKKKYETTAGRTV
jgi:hypothetical protein